MNRRRLAVVVLTLLMLIVLSIAPAGATTDADGPATTEIPADGLVADNAAPLAAGSESTTDEKVQVTVRALVGIASATALGAVVFFWHTSPRRRLRIAGQRINDRTG